jgi:hypothetical protein
MFFDDLYGRFIDVVVEDVASEDDRIHPRCDREIERVEKTLQLIRIPHMFLIGQRTTEVGITHVEKTHLRSLGMSDSRNLGIRSGFVSDLVGLDRIPLHFF